MLGVSECADICRTWYDTASMVTGKEISFLSYIRKEKELCKKGKNQKKTGEEQLDQPDFSQYTINYKKQHLKIF